MSTEMKKREKKDIIQLKEQQEISRRIHRELGVQVTTCGNCGSVVLLDENNPLHVEDGVRIYECYDCGFISECTDFPDLFFGF
ncbi:MAG: hypothetical protein ACOC5T_00545 [Elusimicrobiota bacterium]